MFQNHFILIANKNHYKLITVKIFIKLRCAFFYEEMLLEQCGLESDQSYSSVYQWLIVDILKRFHKNLNSTPNLLCLGFTSQLNAFDAFDETFYAGSRAVVASVDATASEDQRQALVNSLLGPEQSCGVIVDGATWTAASLRQVQRQEQLRRWRSSQARSLDAMSSVLYGSNQ